MHQDGDPARQRNSASGRIESLCGPMTLAGLTTTRNVLCCVNRFPLSSLVNAWSGSQWFKLSCQFIYTAFWAIQAYHAQQVQTKILTISWIKKIVSHILSS